MWLAMSFILHRYVWYLDVPEDVPSCVEDGVGGDVCNRTCTDSGSSFRLLWSDPLVTTVMTELCRLVNLNFAAWLTGSSFIHSYMFIKIYKFYIFLVVGGWLKVYVIILSVFRTGLWTFLHAGCHGFSQEGFGMLCIVAKTRLPSQHSMGARRKNLVAVPLLF